MRNPPVTRKSFPPRPSPAGGEGELRNFLVLLGDGADGTAVVYRLLAIAVRRCCVALGHGTHGIAVRVLVTVARLVRRLVTRPIGRVARVFVVGFHVRIGGRFGRSVSL